MLKLLGRVKDGQIQVQRFFRNDLKKLEGKEVEIGQVEGGKTASQLNYLWGVVYRIISEHTGFTPDEVSAIYKKKFLTYKKRYKGKTYAFTKGISELKKSEMGEFIDKVIRHASEELELIIPEPDKEFIYNY